jgi:niacin transporter
MKKGKTRQLVYAAICVALGVTLPIAFHGVPNAGSVFLPMHVPVLLCGLLCGWAYGLACGILAPLLSFLLTGMPPAAYLPSMLCELAVYGLVAGLTCSLLPAKKPMISLYIRLVSAMLAGRIVYGILNALIFQAGDYSFSVFITAAFVTALPGIVIQLVLIPALVRTLEKVNKKSGALV